MAIGLITGCQDGSVRLWDLTNQHDIRFHLLIFNSHEHQITSVYLTPNAQWAITGSDDDYVLLRDLRDLGKITDCLFPTRAV